MFHARQVHDPSKVGIPIKAIEITVIQDAVIEVVTHLTVIVDQFQLAIIQPEQATTHLIASRDINGSIVDDGRGGIGPER